MEKEGSEREGSKREGSEKEGSEREDSEREGSEREGSERTGRGRGRTQRGLREGGLGEESDTTPGAARCSRQFGAALERAIVGMTRNTEAELRVGACVMGAGRRGYAAYIAGPAPCSVSLGRLRLRAEPGRGTRRALPGRGTTP